MYERLQSVMEYIKNTRLLFNNEDINCDDALKTYKLGAGSIIVRPEHSIKIFETVSACTVGDLDYFGFPHRASRETMTEE